MKSAARSSASPPISPIITMASVSGSSWKACRQSMWMVPAFERPGLIKPGQFGPMMRVEPPWAWAQTWVESCTGMPSVMTTASPIWASTASMTAFLAPAGGTKMTLTSAPVSFIASATPPKTGTPAPSKSTLWPAFFGFTPPTIAVPEASMRWVCLRPSEPVMPWTMTLLFSLRKIDIYRVLSGGDGGPLRGPAASVRAVGAGGPSTARGGEEGGPSSGGGELGGPASGAVHRVHQGHQRVVGLGEDPPALLHVVAVEPDDQRLGRLVAEQLQRVHDAVGDRVAGGDPAEDVDEDALDGGVGQDDVQPVGHDLGRGAATDVEEVGRLDAAELLTGVGDDVQGAHDEPGAVADDADLPVELDVVEVLLLGLGLQRVGRGGVLELLVLRVPEAGVLVEGHLRVEREDGAVGRLGQRVDLDQGGILLGEGVPQLDGDGDHLVAHLGGEAGGVDDLGGLGGVDAGGGVHGDAGQCLGALHGELLDLHAALDAGHGQEGAVGAVEQVGEVVLLGDVTGLGHHHAVGDVALDVQAEDVLGARPGVLGAVGELDATGLAAATGLHLRLDDDRGADLAGDRLRLLGGLGDAAGEHGDTVRGQQVTGLVLEEIHEQAPYRPRDPGRAPTLGGWSASHDAGHPEPPGHEEPQGAPICHRPRDRPAHGRGGHGGPPMSCPRSQPATSAGAVPGGASRVPVGDSASAPQAKTTTSSTPRSASSAASRASTPAASAGSSGRPTASASSWTTVSASCSSEDRPACTTSIPASRRPRARAAVVRSSPSSSDAPTTTRTRSSPVAPGALTGRGSSAAARPAPSGRRSRRRRAAARRRAASTPARRRPPRRAGRSTRRRG